MLFSEEEGGRERCPESRQNSFTDARMRKHIFLLGEALSGGQNVSSSWEEIQESQLSAQMTPTKSEFEMHIFIVEKKWHYVHIIGAWREEIF